MRGTRIDPEACGILCPVKRVDGGKGSADSTSSPANSILRAKGPRHDRTHDQRNAEIAPDQRALSRCRFGKSLSRWPFHLAKVVFVLVDVAKRPCRVGDPLKPSA